MELIPFKGTYKVEGILIIIDNRNIGGNIPVFMFRLFSGGMPIFTSVRLRPAGSKINWWKEDICLI